MYITKLASNEIFSPSNEMHREVGRAKDLSAPLYTWEINYKICWLPVPCNFNLVARHVSRIPASRTNEQRHNFSYRWLYEQ